MLTAHEEAALRAARGSISRSVTRQPSSQPLQAPLCTPELYEIATKITKECVLAKRLREIHFSLTLWQFGATHVEGGVRQEHTLKSFSQLLLERANHLAPKRQGWVIEPTTNLDGKRTNASTLAMHALFLDCDGTGPSGILQQNLVALGFGFVVYESGGSSSELPKWRIVLPLSEPFDVSSEQKRERWKQFYNNARVIFGALGGLHGVGFDPSTETPCHPWFLTERRDVTHAPRQVWYWEGGALNLQAFLIYTANLDEEPEAKPRLFEQRPTSSTEVDFDAFVDALSKATNHIPSGRHDLYLCLPGVLLDRGMHPDTMLALIEAVSSNYPHHHPELHKGNLHNAKTTLAKWESGVPVTRIKTLNDRWPDVAKVVDQYLPNAAQLLATTTAQMLAAEEKTQAAQAVVQQRRRKRTAFGREVAPVVTKMKRSTNEHQKFGGQLIERILNGEPFVTTYTVSQVDALVDIAMAALGFNLPLETTWCDVLDLSSATFNSMNFTTSVERVAAAERAFYKGQGKRRKMIEKIEMQARKG